MMTAARAEMRLVANVRSVLASTQEKTAGVCPSGFSLET